MENSIEKARFIKGRKCLIETHTKDGIKHFPGEVIGVVTALDRDFRVHVQYDNGWEILNAAPECVILVSNGAEFSLHSQP